MYEEKTVEENCKEKWVCQKCKEHFPSTSDLASHVRECPVKLACSQCERRYSHLSGLIPYRNQHKSEKELVKIECLKMAHVMEDYSVYLAKTNNKMIKLHATPASAVEKNANVKELPVNSSPRLKVLDEKLKSMDMFDSINVREYLYAQLDRKQIYDLVHNGLHLGGLSVKAVHYSHIPCGKKPALHFVW